VYTYLDYDVNPYYVGTMTFLESLVSFIAILIVGVVVLGVVNAATLTVYERTRELGTFRALGYTRRQLARLLVQEVTLLSVIALLAGLVLAFSIAWGVNAANVRFSPPGVPGSVRLEITPNLAVATIVAVAMLPLSLLATWLVARRRVLERGCGPTARSFGLWVDDMVGVVRTVGTSTWRRSLGGAVSRGVESGREPAPGQLDAEGR
jgi:predicted lysophospholipase L1 biosynthesis ABC-type transport system permease subunit